MADVTDAAFRRIIAKYGKPDVMFTEFVSCDGLCSSGRKNLLPILKYSEKERPIVAQIFGAKPENFYESAKIIKSSALTALISIWAVRTKSFKTRRRARRSSIIPNWPKK